MMGASFCNSGELARRVALVDAEFTIPHSEMIEVLRVYIVGERAGHCYLRTYSQSEVQEAGGIFAIEAMLLSHFVWIEDLGPVTLRLDQDGQLDSSELTNVSLRSSHKLRPTADPSHYVLEGTVAWVDWTLKSEFPEMMDSDSSYPKAAKILLTAGLLQMTDPVKLSRLTGYNLPFTLGIAWNMINNKRWVGISYDVSGWLGASGEVLDEHEFMNDIACGLGEQWFPDAFTEESVDPDRLT